jgi:diguanylate cyclase (GGDEF)-like protein
MCDLFRSLGNSLDLVDVLSTFDRELRRLICYDAISVHLVDDGRMTPAYAAGDDIANLLASAEDAELLAAVAVKRQPAVNQLCREQGGLELALLFPVNNAAAVTAILALYRRHSQPFSYEDLDLLGELSAKLSASIENARKFARAAESAATDPITGLANGRSLFERLDAELKRARRGATRLAVLQCSIGGLDESSRRLSDHAFQKVAARLRESCREYDFPARTGDDLVLVLPGFGPSDFTEKRGLIQRIVEETGLTVGLPLFAAVGAAFYPEDGPDTEDLLTESARRLNLAKRAASGGEDGDQDGDHAVAGRS